MAAITFCSASGASVSGRPCASACSTEAASALACADKSDCPEGSPGSAPVAAVPGLGFRTVLAARRAGFVRRGAALRDDINVVSLLNYLVGAQLLLAVTDKLTG